METISNATCAGHLHPQTFSLLRQLPLRKVLLALSQTRFVREESSAIPLFPCVEIARSARRDIGKSEMVFHALSVGGNKKESIQKGGFFHSNAVYFFSLIFACAAASLAIGTRNGEQET